jgi:hypothetical protein
MQFNNAIYNTIERKNVEANATLEKNSNTSNDQFRKLPACVFFKDIKTWEIELFGYLENIYKGSYRSSYAYREEKSGKPLRQTIDDIMNHRLMKIKKYAIFSEAMQKAFKQMDAQENKHKRTKNPFDVF